MQRGSQVCATLLATLLLACALLPAAAQDRAARSSYSCVINGKKLVSDRVIPECSNVEQRELNADGSLKRIVAPTPTDDERAEIERKERERKAEIVGKNDAIRRDRNLMQRYPNEAAHEDARKKALAAIRVSVKLSQERIAALLLEKKKLDEDKEFYVNDHVNKPLPSMLKQRVDANDALLKAQRNLVQTQEDDIIRITNTYNNELARLRKLWAGAVPGSLGPVPGPQETEPAAASAPAPLTSSTR